MSPKFSANTRIWAEEAEEIDRFTTSQARGQSLLFEGIGFGMLLKVVRSQHPEARRGR
jgi:hypothetical protein